MKRYIKIAAASAVILLASVILFLFLTDGADRYRSEGSRGIIVALNDIARTAEEHRTDLGVLDGKDCSTDFVIIDMTDNALYSRIRNDTGGKITAESAIQKRYPYKYLTDGSSIWGCVIMLDDGMNGYRELRLRFVAGAIICGGLILLGAVIFGIYIRKSIIVPFRKMKDFAGKVAEGKLDAPLEMDRDNIFGVFSESFDIMREELSDSRERELGLQRKERELVASLSHDLKTPVTGIKLAAELMQMRLSVRSEGGGDNIVFSKEEAESMTESANGILQKAEQIDVLVSDLFASTLDDLGDFRVNLRDENSAVLADIVRNCDDRRLAVTGEIPAVIVSIDTKRMAQVIGNIISNSYKYANTVINIDFSLSEGFLEMRIQDHGKGVPRDELDLITNKFYRGKAWSESGTDGNGLGLYIAKTLMKKMNGDLITESDGDGLAVTLVIPLS